MSQSNTTAAKPTKALREQFGVTGQPVAATKAYVKTVPFDHEHVQARAWILITPDNKRVHVTTYNGKPGKGFDAEQATYEIPEEKVMKKKLKGYEEIAVSECPVASAPGAEVPAPEAE